MKPTPNMIDAAANVVRAHRVGAMPSHHIAKEALTAALSAMWQPIETAPRDGTHVLLLSRTQPVQVMFGYWDACSDPLADDGWMAGETWNCTGWWEENNFTHWMPLPQPPEAT
jgi:hypothetical protein